MQQEWEAGSLITIVIRGDTSLQSHVLPLRTFPAAQCGALTPEESLDLKSALGPKLEYVLQVFIDSSLVQD